MFLCSVELLFSNTKSSKLYFIPKFQEKKTVSQLKQEIVLLAHFFFPYFCPKAVKRGATLKCRALAEFIFIAKERLTKQ